MIVVQIIQIVLWAVIAIICIYIMFGLISSAWLVDGGRDALSPLTASRTLPFQSNRSKWGFVGDVDAAGRRADHGDLIMAIVLLALLVNALWG